MNIKYIIRLGALIQTAYSGATLDVLIKELISWGAKLSDISITAEESPGQRD